MKKRTDTGLTMLGAKEARILALEESVEVHKVRVAELEADLAEWGEERDQLQKRWDEREAEVARLREALAETQADWKAERNHYRDYCKEVARLREALERIEAKPYRAEEVIARLRESEALAGGGQEADPRVKQTFSPGGRATTRGGQPEGLDRL